MFSLEPEAKEMPANEAGISLMKLLCSNENYFV